MAPYRLELKCSFKIALVWDVILHQRFDVTMCMSLHAEGKA